MVLFLFENRVYFLCALLALRESLGMTEVCFARYSIRMCRNFRDIVCFAVVVGVFLCAAPSRSWAQDEFDFLPELPGTGALDGEGEALSFEKTPEELEEEVRREAFDAALEGLLPLRPDEIRELLKTYDTTQEAVKTPINKPPTPEVAVETLSIDPGSAPTVIKVAQGFVTTLNIVDSTGAPWPIQDITWAGDFEIVENAGSDGSGGHFIRIAPQSPFAYGNMSVHMLGLQTPIIISLETSRDIVHYRFDAIVPEAGPLAKVPLIDAGLDTTAGDVNMTGILEGLVPAGAARLTVSGVDGRTSAYKYNGLTYLRTPLTLLSPAWVSSASSADGMRVYALSHAPVLLLSDKGKMRRVHLSDRDMSGREGVSP